MTAEPAGILLVAGAASFLIGAFNPVLGRAWTAPEDVYLGIVHSHRTAWRTTNLLLVAGTALTAAGLWVVPASAVASADALTRAAAAVYAIAATLWIASLAFRLSVTQDAAARFVESGEVDPVFRALGRWAGALFAVFTLLAAAAIVAFGAAIVAAAALPALVGWFAVVVGSIAIVGYLVFGDMPPFVLYLPTGAIGFVLLAAALR